MQLRREDVPKGWTVRHDGNGTVRIFPQDDLIQHEWHEDCVCGPAFELRVFEPDVEYISKSMSGVPDEQLEDHRDGHIYTHHALDGRA